MIVGVRRLEPGDDRTKFASGNIELDRFFHRYAGQNQFRHHLGTTYVAVAEDATIQGFATVAASELAVRNLPETTRGRLPAYPVPVLRLARLAVDRRARGRGIANSLLRAVFALARRMAVDVSCLGIVVDAKPEAVHFYEKLGFVALYATTGRLGDRPEPLQMFLELGAIPKPNE